MNTDQVEQKRLNVSQQKLLNFVSMFLGADSGREDDEHPLAPGPWDPVIRAALKRSSVLGPSPEPWRAFEPGSSSRGGVSAVGDPVPWSVVFSSILARHPELYELIGGGRRFGAEVSLNPQPLPPRAAFLVSVVTTFIARAEFMQEIGDSLAREGEQRGIIIVGGYTSRFADEFCGNGFRLRWPYPGPHPHWFTHELDGIDLLVMAAQFEKSARETFSPVLRQHFVDAGAKFAEAGFARIQ
jgi:hypothetical protein